MERPLGVNWKFCLGSVDNSTLSRWIETAFDFLSDFSWTRSWWSAVIIFSEYSLPGVKSLISWLKTLGLLAQRFISRKVSPRLVRGYRPCSQL